MPNEEQISRNGQVEHQPSGAQVSPQVNASSELSQDTVAGQPSAQTLSHSDPATPQDAKEELKQESSDDASAPFKQTYQRLQTVLAIEYRPDIADHSAPVGHQEIKNATKKEPAKQKSPVSNSKAPKPISPDQIMAACEVLNSFLEDEKQHISFANIIDGESEIFENAFRVLSKTYHPDKSNTAEQFIKIRRAADTLRNAVAYVTYIHEQQKLQPYLTDENRIKPQYLQAFNRYEKFLQDFHRCREQVRRAGNQTLIAYFQNLRDDRYKTIYTADDFYHLLGNNERNFIVKDFCDEYLSPQALDPEKTKERDEILSRLDALPTPKEPAEIVKVIRLGLFASQLEVFRNKISKNKKLFDVFGNPAVIQNIKLFFERGWFDFDVLFKLCEKYLLNEEKNANVLALAEVFNIFADPIFVNLALAKQRPPDIFDRLESFLVFETRPTCQVAADEFVKHLNLSPLNKYRLYSWMLLDVRNGGLKVINEMPPPDNINWEYVTKVLDEHETACREFKHKDELFESTQGTPDYSKPKRWASDKVLQIRTELFPNLYLPVVKIQVLDRIKNHETKKQQEKITLESALRVKPQDKTLLEELAVVNDKIQQLQSAHAAAKKVIDEEVLAALSKDRLDSITVRPATFKNQYQKHKTHLQNRLEKLTEEQGDDPKAKKSNNEVLDILRYGLGLVVGFFTCFLLGKNAYNNWVKKTFFWTRTQAVIKLSTVGCENPDQLMADIEAAKKLEAATEIKQDRTVPSPSETGIDTFLQLRAIM